MDVSINFHGMCAFARQGDNQTHALLLPEKGAHKPVLAIRVSQFIIPNSLQPDMVGHEGNEEIAFWDLKGVTVGVGTDASDPVWKNLSAGFFLGLYHRGSKPKPAKDQQAAVKGLGATVALKSGTLTFLSDPIVDVIVSRDVNDVIEPVVTSKFPSAVQWHGQANEILALYDNTSGTKKGEIELNTESDDIRLNITNVARYASPKGLEHFFEYYSLLELANGDGQLKLESNDSDITVYDCVPPIVLPMP
jgi:hypothetical protein